MFGIGETELAIIVVFAFLMFGPDKLPGLGRTIGRGLRQFREAQEGITKVVQVELVDPLHEAANADEGRVAGRPASTIDDDIDDGAAPVKQVRGESFAERKARLEAERAAEEAAEDATPQKKTTAAKSRPSAAELYGTKPPAKKKAAKGKSDKAAQSKKGKATKATQSKKGKGAKASQSKKGKAAKNTQSKKAKGTKTGQPKKAKATKGAPSKKTKAAKATKKSVSSKGKEAGENKTS